MGLWRRGAMLMVVLMLTVIPRVGASSAAAVSVAVHPQSGPPGRIVHVTGWGFGANETVQLRFGHDSFGTTTTDSMGAFRRSVHILWTALPGEHLITAEGDTSGLTATTSFLVNTNWPQFREGLLHRGQNRYENVLSPSTTSIGKAWTFHLGSGDATYPASSPALVNGVVYVGSFDDHLYALDAATGAKRWSFRTGASIRSSPAVANGVVYVGSEDGRLYALDDATGTQRWSFQSGTSVGSSPTVAHGTVYIGFGDHNVYALDAATGAMRWSFRTGNYVFSSPAVANGVVYVGSSDDHVYALDAATGVEKWSFRTGGFVLSSPSVANGVVFVGSQDGSLYALDAATGTTRWSFHTRGVYSSPAVANGMIYVGAEKVYALDAGTGVRQWSFRTRDFVDQSLAVANGVVYASSFGHTVYALNAANGRERWSFRTRGYMNSSPAVANGMVYVGSSDGNLYALQRSSTEMTGKDSKGPVSRRGVRRLKAHAIPRGDGSVSWTTPVGPRTVRATNINRSTPA
jgi:outer membrane protein assembly factor BamB